MPIGTENDVRWHLRELRELKAREDGPDISESDSNDINYNAVISRFRQGSRTMTPSTRTSKELVREPFDLLDEYAGSFETVASKNLRNPNDVDYNGDGRASLAERM